MSTLFHYSNELAGNIASVLNEKGIRFRYNEKKEVITFALPVRGAGEGLLKFYVFLNKDSSYRIHALLPLKPDKCDDFVISSLFEFFNYVNKDLHKGCMLMNEDCEIWYRLYQECRPGEQFRQTFIDAVRMIVTDVECYSFGIYRVMNSDFSAKMAVTVSDNTRSSLKTGDRLESRDEIVKLERLFDELMEVIDDKSETNSVNKRKADIREEEKDDLTMNLFEGMFQEESEENEVADEEIPECLNLINDQKGDHPGLRVMFRDRRHFDAFLKMCAVIQNDEEQDVKADRHISRLLERMKKHCEDMPGGEKDGGISNSSTYIPNAELDGLYLAAEQAFRLYHALYQKYTKRKKTMHKMGETIQELNKMIDRLV